MKAKQIDLLLQIPVFVGAACLLMPVMFVLFSGTLHGWIWVMPPMTVLLMALGFFMQLLYGNRTGHRYRLRGDGDEAGFSVAHAFVPVCAALILSGLSFFLFRELYYQITIRTTVLYQIASPYPILSAAGMFLAMLAGIVLWFYPLDRLVGINMVVPFCSCAAGLALLMMFTGGVFSVIMTLSFFLFVISMLLLLNQSYITRGYRGSVVSVITPEARLYNMRLVLYMLVAVVLVSALVYTVLSGLGSLFKMLLFTTVYQFLSRGGSTEDVTYYDSADVSGDFTKAVFNNSPKAQVLFYIFLLILVMFVLFVVFRRLREIFAGIGAWIKSIIEFWLVAKTFWVSEEIEILNYVDEETKLQDAAVRDYHAMADKSNTYEAFLSRLNALPTMEEKLGFAYAMMLRACRQAGIPLKTSDTPREAYEKLMHYEVSDAEELTDAFELVKYAEQDLGERTPAAIRSICAVVKKYMY